MKFNRNLAILLALCLIILLALGYIASQQGKQSQAQNENAISVQQVQAQKNITAGQQNHTQNGSISIANLSTANQTAETPGGNITGLDGTEQAHHGGANQSLYGILPNPPNATCNDTEGFGEYYFLAGTTTGSFNGTQGSYSDYCAGNVLHYYECAYPSAGPVINGTYACPLACIDGACTTQANTTNCSDSDGGFVPYMQGTARASGGNISSDYCISGYSLMEYYCLNGTANGMAYNCPYGCSSGACATQPNTTACSDSDGGFIPYLQGTARASGGSTSSDYCINGSSLMEYFCLNGMVDGTAYACPYSCSSGACTNQTNITSGLVESDFMVVDDSLPPLLASVRPFELPPPPDNNTKPGNNAKPA